MRVRTLLLCCLVVAGVAVPARAQDGLEDPPPDMSAFAGAVGVLTMPDVIPVECERVPPATRRLYAHAGDAAAIGFLEAQETGRSSPPDCIISTTRGRFGDGLVADLEVDDPGEATTAAMVFASRGSWFRLRFGDRYAWVQGTGADRFTPYAELMQDSVGMLTTAWDGRFYASPGGRVVRPAVAYRRSFVGVRRVATVKGRVWLLLAAEPEYLAPDVPAEATPDHLGWIPAFDAQGVPTYWFYADPC